MHSTSPRSRGEADAVDRVHGRLARHELDVEVADLDQRRRRASPSISGTAAPGCGPSPGRACGRPRHATACPANRRAPAIVASHTASANGQRVRKRQPEGGSIGLGGSPVIGGSSIRRAGSIDGREASSARV